MGQHAQKPSSSGSSRRSAAVRRRWVAAAASAAVVAAASTTAWAATRNAPAGHTASQPAPPSPSAGTPLSEGTPGTPSAAPSGTPSAAPVAPSTAVSGTAPRREPGSPQVKPERPPAAAQPGAARTEAAARTAEREPRILSSGACGASFYHEGQMTASGERFDPSAMTAAHKTLPLGSRVRVTNPSTGASVTVRVNDRGPYIGGRCLDLSRAAFAAIGDTDSGVMRVRYEVLSR